MKSGWVIKKLGEIGTVVRGKGIRRSETISKGKPCIRYGEIYTSYDILLDEPHSFVTQNVFDASPHIEHGDVLFTLTGENKEEIAKTLAYLGKEEIAAGGDLAIWKGHGLNAKFLAYVMNSPQLLKAKALASNGDIIVHASLKKMAEIPIPIPPLAEQKRIVAKIDAAFEKIDKLKANAEKNLANAKELFRSALDEAMRPKKGWVEKRLGEIGEYRKGPFGSALTKRIFVPKNATTIKVYEQKNAIKKSATIGEYYITREYFNDKMTGFEVLPGDIIVSCAGTIGETFVMPENMEKGIINQALMRMRISPLVDKGYFLYYFDYVLKKSTNELSNGSALKNIPPFSVFKQLLIPLPPIAEQKRIANKLNDLLQKTKNLQQNYSRQIADCAEMRQAILREAFEGRL